MRVNDRDPKGFSQGERDKEGGRFYALGATRCVWIRGEGVHGSGSERCSVNCDVR